MPHEIVTTDISTAPDLARLAHDVASSGTRRVLTENGKALAVVTPIAPRRRRQPRPKPLTRDNPIWEIVGSITEDIGNDVSSNKHRYLAKAYASESA